MRILTLFVAWAQLWTVLAAPQALAAPQMLTVHVGKSGPAAGGGATHTFSAPASANNRCYGTAGSGTSIACTLTTAPATGTLTVVGVMTAFSITGLTVSDGSHSYSVTPHSPSATEDVGAGSAWVAYWYATATGGVTITATASGGTCSFCSITVDTFGVTGAGAVTLDMDLAGFGSTGVTINNPTVTQSASGQLHYCFAVSSNGISTATSPWTKEPSSTSFGEAGEYILSSSGSQSCLYTQSSGGWDSVGASFK